MTAGLKYCERRGKSEWKRAQPARHGGTTAQVQTLTLESLRKRREEILRIASKHVAYNVRIFGSVARGRVRPASDIDFLVEFEPDRTVLDLSSLILDLRDALDREVNVVEIGHAPPSPVVQWIEREAVPL